MSGRILVEDTTMSTVSKGPTTSPGSADLEHAIQLLLTGSKDPAFEARIESESDRITEEIRRKHGVLNVAVELIRESRDEG
jgi:hypothetical protein